MEKTASLTHAAAVTPTHCSLAALQVEPLKHRDAVIGTPGTKEAEGRAEGLESALTDLLGEGLCVAEAEGGLQRPLTHAVPLLQRAGAERGAHCPHPGPPCVCCCAYPSAH